MLAIGWRWFKRVSFLTLELELPPDPAAYPDLLAETSRLLDEIDAMLAALSFRR